MRKLLLGISLILIVFSGICSDSETKSRIKQSSELITDKLVFSTLNFESEVKPWANDNFYELKYELVKAEAYSGLTNVIVINDFKPDFRFTFHPEFSTRISATNSFINFFPNFENPKQINLKLVDLENQTVEVVISAKNGRVEFSKTINISCDYSLISIDLNKTLNGKVIYEILIKSKEIWEGFTFSY